MNPHYPYSQVPPPEEQQMSYVYPQQQQSYPYNYFQQQDWALLLQQLCAQVDYYFSPQNLSQDEFLLSLLRSPHHLGAVPLAVLVSFPKIKQIYAGGFTAMGQPASSLPPADGRVLAIALQHSQNVRLSPDGLWILPNWIPTQQLGSTPNEELSPPTAQEQLPPPASPASLSTSSSIGIPTHPLPSFLQGHSNKNSVEHASMGQLPSAQTQHQPAPFGPQQSSMPAAMMQPIPSLQQPLPMYPPHYQSPAQLPQQQMYAPPSSYTGGGEQAPLPNHVYMPPNDKKKKKKKNRKKYPQKRRADDDKPQISSKEHFPALGKSKALNTQPEGKQYAKALLGSSSKQGQEKHQEV